MLIYASSSFKTAEFMLYKLNKIVYLHENQVVIQRKRALYKYADEYSNSNIYCFKLRDLVF